MSGYAPNNFGGVRPRFDETRLEPPERYTRTKNSGLFILSTSSSQVLEGSVDRGIATSKYFHDDLSSCVLADFAEYGFVNSNLEHVWYFKYALLDGSIDRAIVASKAFHDDLLSCVLADFTDPGFE